MIDDKVDRQSLDAYLTNLCAIHAGTGTNIVLTHVRDEIRKGEFSYGEARKAREKAREEYMDNLVECQGVYSHTFTHGRHGIQTFRYEAWYVKRHWRYAIRGTSVAAIDDKGDEYSGALYRPDCELCGHVSWGIQGLEGALEVAYVHWLDTHADRG